MCLQKHLVNASRLIQFRWLWCVLVCQRYEQISGASGPICVQPGPARFRDIQPHSEVISAIEPACVEYSINRSGAVERVAIGEPIPHAFCVFVLISFAFQYKCVLLDSFNFPNGVRSIQILR